MTKVSVIIPVRNNQQFLPECLSSLCRQSLKDIEIICINDGSSDNSAEILKYYAAKNQKIKIINQNSIGMTACRNWGIVASQGKYLSFIEASDWVDPRYFEKLYNAATQENADIACCSVMYINNETQTEPILKYTKKQTAKKLTQKFKLLHMPQLNYVCNKIYKRDFINTQELYFNVDDQTSDIEWCSEVAQKAEKIVSVPGIYYYHRRQDIDTETVPDERKIKKSKEAQVDLILKNKIHVKIPYAKKTKIRVFGLPIIKILSNNNYKRYYLFGIKIFDVRSMRKY